MSVRILRQGCGESLPSLLEASPVLIVLSTPERLELLVSATLVTEERRRIHSLRASAPVLTPVGQGCYKNPLDGLEERPLHCLVFPLNQMDELLLRCTRSQYTRKPGPHKPKYEPFRIPSLRVLTCAICHLTHGPVAHKVVAGV